VRGIFSGAQVTRGADWKWEDQDGGVSGRVVGVKGWHKETRASVVEVQWGGRGRKNVYRVGHKGKVDLKCQRPGEGGWYNPDHLPVLGGHPGECDEGGDYEFAAGDSVRVDLDLESAKLMQEGHGGWNEAMTDCIRDVGVVNMVYGNGDVQVRYSNNSVFTFNSLVLVKVDIPFHIPGTAVRVLDDIVTVNQLQTVGPGWNDDIALTLGMVGRLTKRNQSGEVQASVNGQRWHYHPQCLQPVPRHLLHNNPDAEDADRIALMKVFAILQQNDPRDGIIYVTATGDVPTLKKSLEKYPEEIDRKLHGRTAVHVACTEGYIGCLKLLLSYHPDIEKLDDNGLRPIHVCAYSNFAEAARLILDYGADINSKDGRENTATMAAGALGHYEVLEVLLEHHLLNLHAGDRIGSTALHCAVIAWRDQAVRLLLEAGADPSIPNYTASTPLHDAASTGNLASVERMVMYFPEHINLQKCDDGHTPLHSAVMANKLDVAHFLLAQPNCEIDNTTSNKSLTALHIAAHEGHTAMVELLVGYGADLNATVDDGNTALMLVLTQKKMKPLDQESPRLNQVEELLLAQYGSGFKFDPYIVVACMLVQEGADPHIKNRIGQSPLQKCPSDLASVVRMFTQGHGEYRGSLKSKSSTLPTTLKKRKVMAPEASSQSTPATCGSFPKDLKKEGSKPVVVEAAAASSVSAERTEGERTEGERAEGEREVEGPRQSVTTESMAPVSPASRQDSDDHLCCMCDQEVNVRLSPCGHTVMCSDCAHIAKRCPTCRVPIGERLIIS
jgi:E3 ubiquitin-protein ligase mind-bomb